MDLVVGATFWLISRKLVAKFPTLIVIKISLWLRLSIEVLFAGFACENAMRSVNWPNFSSDQSDRFGVIFSIIF